MFPNRERDPATNWGLLHADHGARMILVEFKNYGQQEIGPEEMYGERFDIPAPETLIFLSWFSGGELFRSGCCYTRGRGKIFYFRPGHESYPTYLNPDDRRVIANAARWVAPSNGPRPVFGNVRPREA